MICPLHGCVIGIYLVCPHVSQQIEIRLLGRHHQVRHLLLCDACMDPRLAPFEGCDSPNFLLGEPDPARDAARQAFEELWPALDDACVQCTAAAQEGYARAAGLPSRWPAYERTLTGNQVDAPRVNELRQLVESFRSWVPSIVDPRRLAVSVYHGVFTQPLTVEAYAITDVAEQHALVALVRSFLSHHVRNQAVVRFIEAENWQPTPGGGGSRGPERVLAEFWLDCDPPTSGS